MTVEDIAKNSEKWGNYSAHDMQLNRGKYAIYSWQTSTLGEWMDYTEKSDAVESAIKKNGQYVLTTTGASEENYVLNIYDFTGNVFCYTLGNYQNGDLGSDNYPVIRGGSFYQDGNYMAASWNSWGDIYDKEIEIGFRNCIY